MYFYFSHVSGMWTGNTFSWTNYKHASLEGVASISFESSYGYHWNICDVNN